MLLRFSCVILILFFSACNIPAVDKAKQSEKPFFDLKDFFKKEAAFLSANSIRVQKTILQNGERESQEVRIENWQRELSFFSESDINKPSWRDQYTATSERNNNKVILKYRSKNENLSTQALDIELVADTVQSILIIRNIDNQVYRSQQSLTYLAKQGYKINQAQDIVFLSKDDYTIEATYLYE